jgi:predicted lipoprotein
MKSRLAALCTTASEANLAAAREQFGPVVSAWSRIELFRFGPLMTDNRSDRILFWPDRKGIALKQVQGILAEAEETAVTPERLAGKSVAVQGLGALEFVLFGTGSDALATADGFFRCDYASAIAELMSGTAAQMSAEWNDPEGISARMIRPSETDATYRSNDEVLEELVGVMAHGVEAIRDQRILPFLGRDGAAPKPKSALFWRSNQTAPSILANFAGLEALLVGSDIWEYAPTEQFSIGEGAIAAFRQAAAAGATVTGSVEEAVADPAKVRALTDLVTASQTIGKLTGEDLPAALGLSVGFSSLDGD